MHAGTSHSSKRLRPGILEPHAAMPRLRALLLINM